MMKFHFKWFLVVFLSLFFSIGQASAQSVGDQTLISVNSWNAYVHLPSGYSSNPTTSYPTIIFMPGLGEVGTNAAKLLVAGPSKFIASGWNGVVTVDGVSIEPIIISLQPSSAWAVESAVNTRIQTLKSMYRIDPNRLYLTGLSMGGWESLTFVTADPYDSTAPYGPFTYASQVAAVVGVQSVKPEDNTPYPDLFDNFARIGGKLLAFEQVNDGRDTQTYVNRMNSVVSGSAIFKATSFGGGGHCCWDEFYDPVKTFSGLNGRTESIYQWMLRQSLSGSTPPPPSNISPTANAGTDQTITLPTSSITLTGVGTDPDGTITNYSWTKLSGGSATITSPSASTTTVTGLTQGTYTFRLTVTDNGGLTAADDVFITVNAGATNTPPTVYAGADQTITLPTNSVTLSATATDAEGNSMTYLWTKISGNGGVIHNPNSLSTSVTNLTAGTYTFWFTATDSLGASNADQVVIIVNPSTTPPPTGNSKTYLIDFGSQYTTTTASGWNNITSSSIGTSSVLKDSTNTTTPATLNIVDGFHSGANTSGTTVSTVFPATATQDSFFLGNYNNIPDSSALIRITGLSSAQHTFTFFASRLGSDGVNRTTQYSINGQSVSLNATDNVNSFVELQNISVSGNVDISITQTGTWGYLGVLKITEQVGQTAQDTQAPSVPSNLSGIAVSSSQINLSWTASTDNVSVAGYKIYRNGVQVGTSTIPSYNAIGLTAGTNYTFAVSAYDSANNNSAQSSTVSITTQSPSNISPTANAGTDQTITLPTSSITLTGVGTDPDGTITNYSWTKLSGGSATITSPSASTTTVTGLTQGTYTFRLTVTDNGGLTAADDVNIVVNTQTTGGGKTIILNATATGEIYKSDMSSLNIQPCDTIAIPAGNYTNGISIGFNVGFSGSANCPVTIINSGGKVQAKYFRIYNSQYFKMTGSGSADQYGFLISGDTGATGLAIGRQTSDYEVERVESSNNSTAFMFKVNPVAGDLVTQYPNWIIKNVKIHDNYIHDISGEGMYIGHTDISGTSYSGGLVPVQMQNVKIYNNRVENTDWDGIQLSDARQGAELYNNTVTNYGRINLGSQQSGIILGGNTTGSVYNNTVKTGTGSGISVFGYGDVSVTNNVLENAGTGTRQDAMYLNDNRVTLQTNPGLRVTVSGNVIKNPNTQATAIKNANYNGTSLPGSITNNTICDGSGRSLSQLITSGAGDTISGNILSTAGCTTTPPPTDTTPPTTSLTSPTNNQTLSGTTTLSATATDNTAVTKVDFYRGTTLLGSDTTSPYTYSWNTTTSTNGTYQLSTKAYDAAGNVGTSPSVTVVVNNTTTPPPGGGGVGSGGGGTTGSGGGSGTVSSGGGGGISVSPQIGSGNTQQNISNQNNSVRVNVDTHLRVRSTPGGVQITQIANGATGILLEENTQIIQGYTWVKVKFSNGVEGWVAKDFLISDVSATNQSQQNSAAVSVTAQQLNVRILPGGEILSRVAIGSTGVLVIDQEQIKNNLTWVKVKFSNGVEGWVAKDFLSFSNSTQLSGGSIQTTANLRVRTTPNGVIMTIVPLGSLGTITQGSKTDAWVKVKFSNGVEGWVSSTYIK